MHRKARSTTPNSTAPRSTTLSSMAPSKNRQRSAQNYLPKPINSDTTRGMRDKNRHIGGQPTGRGRIGALSAILGPAFVVVGLILGLYSAAATAKSPVPPSAEATSSSTATKAGAKTKTGATTKTSTAKSAAAVKAKTGATKKASVPKRAAKSAPAKKATKKVVRYMPKGTFAVFCNHAWHI